MLEPDKLDSFKFNTIPSDKEVKYEIA